MADIAAVAGKNGEGEHGKELFHEIILRAVAPALKDGVRAHAETRRRETLGLLAALVRLFPEHPRFADMVVLASSDDEQDFFSNICHIQRHRRIRAVRRLEGAVREEKISQSTLTNFMLPHISHYIFECMKVEEQNLVEATIETIGAMSRVFSWKNYSALLDLYLGLMRRKVCRESC
jgi:U3 small nucleolar RNA-associated protein 20